MQSVKIKPGKPSQLSDWQILVQRKFSKLKELHKNMKVTLEGNTITVVRPNDEPENKSLHGLTRTLINNMIEGVVHEFKRELEIIFPYQH